VVLEQRASPSIGLFQRSMMPLSRLPEQRKIYRKNRASRGLCQDCPNKTRVGKVHCEKCAKKNSRRQIKYLSEFSWKKAQRHRENTYGLTLEKYVNMLFEQNGRCELRKDFLRNRIHVDHDHKRNCVRALLCTRCNTGLGFIEKNKKLFKRALAYLRRHGVRP